MNLRHSTLFKRLLLSLTLFALALSSLDFTPAGYAMDGNCSACEVAFESVNPSAHQTTESLFEELDNPDGKETKRRLPVAVANSVSLKVQSGVDSTVSSIGCCPLARPVRCPIEIKIVSWLEKEKDHLEHVKAQPVWLLLGILLI